MPDVPERVRGRDIARCCLSDQMWSGGGSGWSNGVRCSIQDVCGCVMQGSGFKAKNHFFQGRVCCWHGYCVDQACGCNRLGMSRRSPGLPRWTHRVTRMWVSLLCVAGGHVPPVFFIVCADRHCAGEAVAPERNRCSGTIRRWGSGADVTPLFSLDRILHVSVQLNLETAVDRFFRVWIDD
jgi:hypothetical protein